MVRMRWWRAMFISVARLRWIPWGLMTLLSACAFVPHENEWIAVGHTTREEVIDAYGEPDLVMAAAEGETVVYRLMHASRSTTPLEIPTAQAGPRGMMTAKMEPIHRESSAAAMPPPLRKRPDRELRIRYDARGIVREIIR
jgi:hypothetical protein